MIRVYGVYCVHGNAYAHIRTATCSFSTIIRTAASIVVPHVQNELNVRGKFANFNELYNVNELDVFFQNEPLNYRKSYHAIIVNLM